MRIHIVLDAVDNVVATLPGGEFETAIPGTEDRTNVRFEPLLLPGQRRAEVELPKELEGLDSAADLHAALAEYEVLGGRATLLPRDVQGNA